MRDEMFGRVSGELVAKFLTQKLTQNQFIKLIKKENGSKVENLGTDFNYVDVGYQTQLPHSVRINKRPLTGQPREAFGDFTQNLFKFGHESNDHTTLNTLLNLTKQNVLLLDMRGEGVNAQKEFNDFHMVGSVSFPHGWINRENHFQALNRFKNLDHKVIVIFLDNERHGTSVAKTLSEKGFNNIYLMTGGIQQFYIDYPKLVEGAEIPNYEEYKWFVATSSSPKKK